MIGKITNDFYLFGEILVYSVTADAKNGGRVTIFLPKLPHQIVRSIQNSVQ